MKLIQSPATVVILGGLLFFGTMFGVVSSTHFGPVHLPEKAPPAPSDDPSWKFRNPEIDQWVAQIKEERDALAVREQQLKDWEARLNAESKEISTVTRAVSNVQADIDKRIVAFKEQEKENIKKQVKVVAGMTPDGAATMLWEMPDDDVVKLLFSMKNDIAGGILDAMSRQSTGAARRAAMLAQRIKDVMSMPATNNLTANASR